MDQANPAQANYKAILSELADFEPKAGYQDATDLPSGCPTDVHKVIALRARPDLMNRVDLNPLVLAALLEQASTNSGSRYHRLGMHLARELDAAIAHQLVTDLQEACEARRDEEAWDAESERRTSLTPEQQMACELGVPTLFGADQ